MFGVKIDEIKKFQKFSRLRMREFSVIPSRFTSKILKSFVFHLSKDFYIILVKYTKFSDSEPRIFLEIFDLIDLHSKHPKDLNIFESFCPKPTEKIHPVFQRKDRILF